MKIRQVVAAIVLFAVPAFVGADATKVADLLNDLKKGVEKTVQGNAKPPVQTPSTSIPTASGAKQVHKCHETVPLNEILQIQAKDIVVTDKGGPVLITSNEVQNADSRDPRKGSSGILSYVSEQAGSPRPTKPIHYRKFTYDTGPAATVVYEPADCAMIQEGDHIQQIYKLGSKEYQELYAQYRFAEFLPEPFERIVNVTKDDLLVLDGYAGHIFFAAENYAPGDPGFIPLRARNTKGEISRPSARLTVDVAKQATSQIVWRIIKPDSKEYKDALWKFENRHPYNYGAIKASRPGPMQNDADQGVQGGERQSKKTKCTACPPQAIRF